MKRAIKLTLAVALMMSATSLFAQKFGRINTQEIIMNMSETKEMQTGYSSDLNVDHFEISRVVVQKELVDTGSDSSSSSED